MSERWRTEVGKVALEVKDVSTDTLSTWNLVKNCELARMPEETSFGEMVAESNSSG